MYKCKACGRIISDEEYAEEQDSGSGGYCHCEFGDGNRILNEMVQVEWWEMLNWNNMKNAWILLPEETKIKVREAGLAPEFDTKEE